MNRRRKRLTRKNNSLERPLSISFTATSEGVDIVATYQLATGEVKESINTKFTRQLALEEQERISDAFFLGYSFAQFKVDCPELSESCTGWRRSRLGDGV